jgi:hypothetical protein
MDVLPERFINNEDNYVPLMTTDQLIPFLNLLVAYLLSAAVDDNPEVFDPALVGILIQHLGFQAEIRLYSFLNWTAKALLLGSSVADQTQHCSHSARLQRWMIK